MITQIGYIAVILVLILAHHLERKDLYNRIMSKNLSEYKGEKVMSVKSAHRQVLNRWRGKDGEDG